MIMNSFVTEKLNSNKYQTCVGGQGGQAQIQICRLQICSIQNFPSRFWISLTEKTYVSPYCACHSDKRLPP